MTPARAGLGAVVLSASCLMGCSDEPCDRLYKEIEGCGLVGAAAPLGPEAFSTACKSQASSRAGPTSCLDLRDCDALSDCLRRVGRDRMKQNILSKIERSLQTGHWEAGLSSCRWARTVWQDPEIEGRCIDLARAAVSDLRTRLKRAVTEDDERADACVDLARFGELLSPAERQQAQALCTRAPSHRE